MSPICPLCESPKIFTLRAFDLAALRTEWVNGFGFDPFLEFVSHETQLRRHLCGDCQLEFFSPKYVGGFDFYERLSKLDWYYEENKWEFDEAIRRLISNPQIKTVLEIRLWKGFFLREARHLLQRVRY